MLFLFRHIITMETNRQWTLFLAVITTEAKNILMRNFYQRAEDKVSII